MIKHREYILKKSISLYIAANIFQQDFQFSKYSLHMAMITISISLRNLLSKLNPYTSYI